MAYTQEQIDVLEAAIGQGVLEVQYADKTVKYRSLDEMLRILNMMKGIVDPVATRRGNRRYAEHNKGT